MNTMELNEKKVEIAKELRSLTDKVKEEKRGFVSEEESKWDKLTNDYDSVIDELDLVKREKENSDREKRLQSHEFSNDKKVDVQESRDLSIQAWFRTQRGIELSDLEQRACAETGLNPHNTNLDINLLDTVECRALSAQIGSAGAFTIERGFINNLERALLAFGSVRTVADVMRTDKGNELDWPTTDDTANKGELLGENKPTSEQDVTLGTITLNAYKYSSKEIRVPSELLEDSAFDFVPILGDMLGERIGRITEQHYTTGNAASQPNGIVTASVVGEETASSTAFTASEILNLIHSVDPAYRSAPSVGFMMHDLILLALRKLVDGEGLFIWQPSIVVGEPDRLFGFPVSINQEMDSTLVASNKIMLFGEMAKYKIRDVRTIRVRRLVELHALSDQEGFVSFFRTDGQLLDAGTNPIKNMQLKP